MKPHHSCFKDLSAYVVPPSDLPALLKYIKVLSYFTGNVLMKRTLHKSTTTKENPSSLKDGSEGRAGMTHLQQRWIQEISAPNTTALTDECVNSAGSGQQRAWVEAQFWRVCRNTSSSGRTMPPVFTENAQ